MKGQTAILICALLAGSGLLVAPAPVAAEPTLQCTTGPAERTFGGITWLLYACDDGRSVVLMTPEGHPAYPYYFMIVPGMDKPRLIGEGWDRQQLTNAAFDEISAKLSLQFVATLHAEAEAAAAARNVTVDTGAETR